MRKIFLVIGLIASASLAIAQSGPKFSTSGGVASSTSTFSGGELTGGTYAVNGTTGVVSTPIVNLRPGVAPASPQNGDCWTTTAGFFCRINGATVGPYGSATGTVTSVGIAPPSIFTAGSPVTSTGNLSFTLNSQTAGSIFAAPVGSTGTPTFRTLTGSDIPAINLGTTGNGGITAVLPVASGGTGSTTASAATVFAGPVGSTGAPAFRALAGSDIPTLNQNTTGTASNVTGIIAVGNGGTGSTTAATARTALGLGTSAVANTGTSGATVPLLVNANTWGNIQTAPGLAVSQLGNGLTGQLALNVDPAANGQVVFLTAGNPRWILGKAANPETGGSVGSDFTMGRYDDAGNFLGHAIVLARNSGQVTFGGDTTQATKQFVGSINPANQASNWIETLRPASTQIAQSVSVNAGGYIGHLAATRSSDNTCTGGCMGAIGYEAIVHNNNVAQVQYAYGAYIEAVRDAGAGGTHGVEIDVRNKGNTVQLRPDNMFAANSTPGLWVASGAGYAENDSSVAIGIVKNGTRWEKGIVFDTDGIATRPDTLKEAISMGLNQAVTWRDSSGNIAANIYANGTPSGSTTVSLAFYNGTNAIFAKEGGDPLLNVGRDRTIATTPVILANYTVALAPVCSSDKKGAMIAFTDLMTITYNGVPAGGGALSAPGYCTGVSWTIH